MKQFLVIEINLGAKGRQAVQVSQVATFTEESFAKAYIEFLYDFAPSWIIYSLLEVARTF